MDAIKAALHSYKSLATRPELHITLQVPKEYAADALKMLGVVDPSGTQWFALTRIHAEQSSSRISGDTKDDSGPHNGQSSGITPTATKGEETADKPHTPFRDKPRSVQAALKCQDEAFTEWMWMTFRDELAGLPNLDELPTADDALKFLLDIKSKRELDTFMTKAEAWDRMLTSFTVRGMAR